MKTAILVNGIYRPEDWSVESLLKNIEVVFPDTDVFFHTWDECLSDVPEGIKVESCPEPMLDYNPMQDPEPSKSPHYIGRRETRKDEDIAIRGTKQLVGYADLYEKVIHMLAHPQVYRIAIICHLDHMILNYYKR